MFNLSLRREKGQFGIFRIAKGSWAAFDGMMLQQRYFRLSSLALGRIQQEITLAPVAIHPCSRHDGLSGDVFVDENMTIISGETAR